MLSLSGCGEESDLRLGNVVILGDSYSTFEGHIPEGYATYYSPEGLCGIDNVKETWWHRLIKATRSKLLLNSSYSGSTVCHTGYSGDDYSEFSFVTRTLELVEGGFFKENRVDTLIIYGGLNDCWAGAPLGEIKYDDFTDEELYSFLPALSRILGSVSECSPKTRLVLIIDSQFTEEMKAGMKTLAEHYGADTVCLDAVELEFSHPTEKGMKQTAEQIISNLSDKK